MSQRIGREDPSDHATPSNVRLGTEIHQSRDVEIVESTGQLLAAKVGGGQTRSARFELDGSDLRWHCACRRDEAPWCKHLVALALAGSSRG